jgi:hypothetical protein
MGVEWGNHTVGIGLGGGVEGLQQVLGGGVEGLQQVLKLALKQPTETWDWEWEWERLKQVLKQVLKHGD